MLVVEGRRYQFAAEKQQQRDHHQDESAEQRKIPRSDLRQVAEQDR